MICLVSGNHLNQPDTLQMLSEGYIWNGMKENCEDFVHSCCKHPKPANIKRNAAFKKFDLLQRVSLFNKIRVMVSLFECILSCKHHIIIIELRQSTHF